jgi:hypothetical protein
MVFMIFLGNLSSQITVLKHIKYNYDIPYDS